MIHLKTKLKIVDWKVFKPHEVFIWKNYNFEEKLKKNGSIISEHFYSHREGYKMWIIMFPGGTGIYRNTHLCLQFGNVAGEYDQKLTWPFNHVLKVGLVNQETLKLQELSLKCEIPHGSTSPLFYFSHEELQKTGGFFKDDCLIVLCFLLNDHNYTLE